MKPYESILKCLKQYPIIVQDYNKLTLKLNRPRSFQHQKLMGNICTMYHFLKCDISELYDPATTSVVKYFTDQYQMSATKDHIWLMKQLNQQRKLRMKLFSIHIEQKDNPYLRKTLYFKQLKDIHKHIHIDKNPDFPPPIQQVRKTYLQQVFLDKKNPFGIPKHTPKLFFQLLIDDIWLKLQMYLGDVKLKNLSFLKQKPQQNDIHFITPAVKNTLTFDRIEQKTQRAIFDLLTNDIKIGEAQLLMIHKLAFIAGNFTRIANLISAMNFLMQYQTQRYKE